MLADTRYDRFRNDSVTSAEEQPPPPTGAMSGQVSPGSPSAAPRLGQPSPPFSEPQGPEEQDMATTFCMMIPRMAQWKFASPAAFLSRSPSGASKELTLDKAEAGGGLGSVFGACDPVCSTPCTLQVINRLRGGGGRKATRTEGYKLTGEEWSRKGSFISKPSQGWLHPDDRLQGPGVSYIVRYMGCIEVLRSMRSLDFNTRTQVTREAINRLHEAVPGVRGTWKRKVANKSLASVLGRSNLRFAGISIAVNISIEGLNLSIPTSRQVIANHHMQAISFASGGDADMTDYVAYVAKDPINQRACHILECCEGLAQNVISTIGQAFELRFKQYLHSPPKVAAPPDRMTGGDEPAWGGEEEHSSERDYYNSIPGKEPPLGGIQDSRVRDVGAMGYPPTQTPPNGQWPQAGSPARRPPMSHSGSQWELEGQGQAGEGFPLTNGRALGVRDYEEHMYVNTQNLDGWNTDKEPYMIPEDSPKKDLFDMRPFEDALKLHESGLSGGTQRLEDQWPSPPTRRAPVAPTEEQLRGELWYHGKMSRREAEKVLQRDGDFLVRDSITNPGQYVLTGMHRGQPKHLLLVDPEGVVRTKDVLFESISHLISYHLHNQQPIVAAESELHLRQVVPRRAAS